MSRFYHRKPIWVMLVVSAFILVMSACSQSSWLTSYEVEVSKKLLNALTTKRNLRKWALIVC